MIETAISLGIVLSLISIEFIGLAAGGIIVPGYVALQFGDPLRLLGLILIAIATFAMLRCIGRVTFLFGRRQMVVALLVGTVLSILAHRYLDINFGGFNADISPIGWVLPGLVAHWSLKQGLTRTLSMLMIMAVIVRFMLILAFDGQAIPPIQL